MSTATNSLLTIRVCHEYIILQSPTCVDPVGTSDDVHIHQTHLPMSRVYAIIANLMRGWHYPIVQSYKFEPIADDYAICVIPYKFVTPSEMFRSILFYVC